MAFGATGRYGMTSAIAPPCWESSFHEWKEVLPFLVKTANDLGLVVFDWAGPSIYRPATQSGTRTG
jgi:hypothetical protein